MTIMWSPNLSFKRRAQKKQIKGFFLGFWVFFERPISKEELHKCESLNLIENRCLKITKPQCKFLAIYRRMLKKAWQ